MCFKDRERETNHEFIRLREKKTYEKGKTIASYVYERQKEEKEKKKHTQFSKRNIMFIESSFGK